MKNIAIITRSLNSGGAERMAANMSLMLAHKYNVFLFTFNSKDINYPYGGKLVTYERDSVRSNIIVHSVSIFRRIRETKKLKRKYSIDVTISHQDRPNIINILGGIGEKKICCLHTSPTSVMAKHSLRAIIQKIVCKKSDRYIAVSKVAENDLVSIYGYPSNKVKCIYNFCDIDFVRKKSLELPSKECDLFLSQHKYCIVFSGRLIKSKGYHHLFRALKVLIEKQEDIGLIILGEGELRNNLDELALRLGINSFVFFAGYVDNPFSYISRADAFVMPSEYEGLPMVLIEAAACGCPIISCDIVSGPREILAPGTDIRFKTKKKEYAEYGILVPSCCESAFDSTEVSKEEFILADSILEILTNDAVRERYKKQSALLAKRFSEDSLMDEWIKLIEE